MSSRSPLLLGLLAIAPLFAGESTPVKPSAGIELSPSGAANAASAAKVPVAPDSRAFLFEAQPADFSSGAYATTVESLLSAYERDTARFLKPGKLGKVALKLYTTSGPGLATPKSLTDAVVASLEKRGFKRANILLVDQQEKHLRDTGYLPALHDSKEENYKGSPVLALDSGKYFDPKVESAWTYPSSLPSKDILPNPDDFSMLPDKRERVSQLPMPLLFDVDFWINLPMVCDNGALGVSGALANATLLNVGNARRFWDNPANAQKAAVEIAAIPELKDKFELTIMPLELYQFVGGPKFDAGFTVSEKRIWLSANPVILDYLMWKRINAGRDAINKRSGLNLPLIEPEPGMFSAANSGDIRLGSCRPADLKLVQVK